MLCIKTRSLQSPSGIVGQRWFLCPTIWVNWYVYPSGVDQFQGRKKKPPPQAMLGGGVVHDESSISQQEFKNISKNINKTFNSSFSDKDIFNFYKNLNLTY